MKTSQRTEAQPRRYSATPLRDEADQSELLREGRMPVALVILGGAASVFLVGLLIYKMIF